MVAKNLQPKSKHHHVWANYLARWSENGRDVYYTTETGKIAFDSVKGIAMEKWFYKVKRLTDSHVNIIKGFSDKSTEALRENHMSYLKDFLFRQKLEDIYTKSGKKVEGVEDALHATRCNMLENLHSAHENEVKPIISALAENNLEILDDSRNLILFLQFFGHQITRTKAFKDVVMASTGGAKSRTEKHIAKEIQGCWWFLSYMFGMNIGASLLSTRKEDKHCLLINTTESPFVTSDQAIINTHPSLRDDVFEPPEDEHCDFYYPVSPNVAYMINKSDRFEPGKVNVSENIVKELNIKMAKKSNKHIIGNTKESLTPLRKYVGKNLDTIKGSRAL